MSIRAWIATTACFIVSLLYAKGGNKIEFCIMSAAAYLILGLAAKERQ
jgi:hypothetical protein